MLTIRTDSTTPLIPPSGPEVGSKKIKSLSGQLFTWTNQTIEVRRVLNPNNKKLGDCCLLLTAGKIARFILRFSVGFLFSFVGGAAGVLRHLWGMGASIFQWKWSDCWKHGKSLLADVFRASILGTFASTIHYALFPDNYFAKEDKRTDGTMPRQAQVSGSEEFHFDYTSHPIWGESKTLFSLGLFVLIALGCQFDCKDCGNSAPVVIPSPVVDVSDNGPRRSSGGAAD